MNPQQQNPTANKPSYQQGQAGQAGQAAQKGADNKSGGGTQYGAQNKDPMNKGDKSDVRKGAGVESDKDDETACSTGSSCGTK